LTRRTEAPDHQMERATMESRMRFAYYKRLNLRQRAIYDRSDQAGVIRVPGAGELAPHVIQIATGLEQDDRTATEVAARRLVEQVLGRLHVPPVEVRVLAVRPSSHREELHGLYEWGGNRKQPVVSVWMRTAQKRQVVAFRTFMRTLLHEVVHHLDYQLLRLGDSYHTAGFYKRAESLYRQLAPAALIEQSSAAPQARPPVPPPAPAATGGPMPRRIAPERPATPRGGRTPAPPASAPTAPKPRAPKPDPQPFLPFLD
jgi:hypothetical protein